MIQKLKKQTCSLINGVSKNGLFWRWYSNCYFEANLFFFRSLAISVSVPAFLLGQILAILRDFSSVSNEALILTYFSLTLRATLSRLHFEQLEVFVKHIFDAWQSGWDRFCCCRRFYWTHSKQAYKQLHGNTRPHTNCLNLSPKS